MLINKELEEEKNTLLRFLVYTEPFKPRNYFNYWSFTFDLSVLLPVLKSILSNNRCAASFYYNTLIPQSKGFSPACLLWWTNKAELFSSSTSLRHELSLRAFSKKEKIILFLWLSLSFSSTTLKSDSLLEMLLKLRSVYLLQSM